MEKFSSTSKRGIEPRWIGDKFDRERERLFSRIPRSKKGVEAKEGAKLEQKARRGETRQVSKQASKEAEQRGRKEGGKGTMEKESGGRQRAALARVLPATGARQTNIQRLWQTVSFSLSRWPSPLFPFFLLPSLSPSLSPSPRTRFLLIDSSTRIGAQERSRRFASIQ